MWKDKAVMMVDDDMIDTMTVRRAFRELEIQVSLVTAENGEEAIRYLEEANDKPGLILLDLNMPVMNGVEFLGRVKSDPDLRRIPVVVLTTSREMEDRQECFGHSVAGYMVKPIDYADFKELMRTIDQYWSRSEAL